VTIVSATTTATAWARAVTVLLAVVGIVLLQSVLCAATVALPGCCPVSGTHAASGSSAGAGADGVEHRDAEVGPSGATAAGSVGQAVSRVPSAGLIDPGESGGVLGACLLFVIAALAALAGIIRPDLRWTPWRRAVERRRDGRLPVPAVRLDQLCVLRA